MPEPQTRLDQLTADTLVGVGAQAGQVTGSGFWVAPGLVLTCAHVVPDGLEQSAWVRWDGHDHAARVVQHVPPDPDRVLWPFPDLALLRVRESGPHPCAWLSETRPTAYARLRVFGYSDLLDEGLQPSAVDGRLSGTYRFDSSQLWQFKDNEIRPGMSGGPVLDRRTGSVCGVITTTIEEGADRGGYVVPVRGLRVFGGPAWTDLMAAHDGFHDRERNWPAARSQLPATPGALTPGEEAELMGLLARRPAVGEAELRRLLTYLSPTTHRTEPPPMMSLRDLVHELTDVLGNGPDAGVFSVLRLAEHLYHRNPASPDARQAIRDWSTATAARHGLLPDLTALRARAAESPASYGGTVIIQIAPGATSDDVFRLSMTVEQHDGRRWKLISIDNAVLSLPQVRELVRDRLDDALARLEGKASIEFIVPEELFTEPFDEIRLSARSYTNLGRKYPLVLRDLDRLQDPSVRHDWRTRWRVVERGESGQRWLRCGEALSQEDFSAELEEDPKTAVLAMPHPPVPPGLLRVALDAGVPVALWRRAGDERPHGPDECDGQVFQAAMTRIMATTEIAELPENVRRLRNRVVGRRRGNGEEACRGVVLLWDDPTRTGPDAEMVREPHYEPDEDA